MLLFTIPSKRDIIMTIKNPRINVTFEKATAGIITQLAHQEHKSVAGLVRELALEALEQREDMYLSKIAAELDQDSVKVYTHKDAWK
jgi:hypothetical protein